MVTGNYNFHFIRIIIMRYLKAYYSVKSHRNHIYLFKKYEKSI